jgi:hypothetical protein
MCRLANIGRKQRLARRPVCWGRKSGSAFIRQPFGTICGAHIKICTDSSSDEPIH